ncbi:substrate-binding periplasmic protein [Amycolatopsis sp. NPDC051903]|uniref:substrate-binding periplasmic protein n=1 Tax=Amycolatopsis sp. NPDC051903 TaxID=3363936 RepID=UPI0037AE9C08
MARRTTLVLFTAGVAAAVLSAAACGPGDQAGSGYGLASPGTITAGVTAGDAPFVSPDATGKPVGLLVDLNNAIAQRMGLKITYRMTTVSAGLPLVTAGQLDMLAIGMLPTPERKKSVDFTQPFYLASDDVVVRADSAVKAAGDLAGKRVGAGLGSAQADFATAKIPGATLISQPTNGAGVNQLLNGNLDAMVLASTEVPAVFRQSPGRLRIAYSAPHEQASAMPINRKLTAFEKAYGDQLKTTMDDGTFLRLYDRYFPGEPYPSPMFTYWPQLRGQLQKGK